MGANMSFGASTTSDHLLNVSMAANMSSGALSSKASGALSTSDRLLNVSMAANISFGASSSFGQWKYDVFLSFSGEDTRTNFTDHLFNALIREGIHTFRDNEGLRRGEDISSGLMKAIEDSRIAIIVFSEKYASSTWCLDELVQILDCKRDGRTEEVLPVFYKIDPSDVRKQSNTYSKAFRTHEKRFNKDKERVKRWRNALTEAANLSGWDQRKVADGHEAELIKEIVTKVLEIKNHPGCLHVATFPTGLEPHMNAICGLLREGGSDVVLTVGIYGPGGIGKTTIAKAVFNIMSRYFDASCFLADVREVSSQQQGSLQLQKQLLSGILKREGVEIHNEHRGVIMVSDHLRRRRVLIVFDDVVKMTHLYQLFGGVDRFCPGSRIILTTRDEHLLTELDVDDKYKYRVETMDENESLQLFCRHAFKQDHPLQGYEQLSEQAVHYAGGLPLALVTLGSSLYQRSPTEWVYQLEKLKVIPIDDVLKKLKISYDLLDELDRSIFLDISCFFLGEDIDYVSACYLSGAAAIKNLKERSLVTIDEVNCLSMHDLIRDMGREIVRNESPKNPGERSRVWKNADSFDILKNLTGTVAVEGLQIDKIYGDNEFCEKFAKEFGQKITLGFSRMPNLRFLQISFSNEDSLIYGEPFLQEGVILFENLVWLDWDEFPFKCIPNNFHLGNLVILEMRQSNLELIWEGTKNLPMLKVLDLGFSSSLTQTPDFSGIQNLERLNLEYCESLVEIHESIHCLKKLVELNLRDCANLKNLPRGIGKLESLEVLDVAGCRQLENLPKGFGELKRLKRLEMSRGNWTDDGIAVGLGELSSLESLDLSSAKLKCLPMLPSSLCSLSVGECCQLERLPNLSNMTEIEGLEGFLKSATFIDLSGCVKLETSVKKRIFQDICTEFGDDKIRDIFLPGNEVPDWFAFENVVCWVIAQPHHNMEMLQPQQQGLIICSTFKQPNHYCGLFSVVVEVVNNSKNSTWQRGHGRHARGIDHYRDGTRMITWMMKIPNNVWKSIAAQYEYGDTLTVSAYQIEFPSDIRYPADKIGFHFPKTAADFWESESSKIVNWVPFFQNSN